MLLHLVVRGKIGRSPEAELVERYIKRIGWPTRISELPDTGGKLPPRDSKMRIVALDELGAALRSVEIASRLGSWRDEGVREVQFLIGGANGLDRPSIDSADLLLSFGPATWPHLMARAMLAEQLYRATSLLAGHPYHREG